MRPLDTPPPAVDGTDAALVPPAELVAQVVRTPRPLLLVADFDGTLAEPRLDPWAAAIVPRARRALRLLAARPDVHIAFLSGRTADDLVRRVRVGGASYLGNQGFERGDLSRGRRAEQLHIESPAPDAWPVTASVLAEQVPLEVPDAWLIVEPKLPAITFHYRGAPDIRLAAGRVSRAVDRHDPAGRLIRHAGRRSLELRPAGAPDKGSSFEMLLGEVRPATALMLGDDATDVPAFQTLRAARAARSVEGLAIGVGDRPDAVDDTRHAVDVRLTGPTAVAAFLTGLARHLAAR